MPYNASTWIYKWILVLPSPLVFHEVAAQPA